LGLFGNKSDHPLANLKSVQELLNNLPATDMVKALEEAGQWLEELFDPENDFRLDHKFAVLRMLDDAAHPHLRKVIQGYFTVAPLASFQEYRLWNAMNSYYAFSEQGYQKVLLGLRKGDKGSSSIKSAIPLICCRGIYAIFGRLECAAVRYAVIDPQLWIHLADYYDHAEVEQCLDEETQLYGGAAANSTVQRMFAGLVIWYSISVGALRPLDMHIAKCLLMHLRKYFTANEKVQADSLFMFDLANPVKPSRTKDGGAMYPLSTRFVSMGGPLGYLESLLKTLGKDHVPAELNFGVAYSPEAVIVVVNRIASYCKSPLPSRRHQRRKISMSVKVLSGFDNVVEQSDVGLNTDSAKKETWEVEDMSATGLSCVLPAGNTSTVKIGALIAFQPEKAAPWGAGIVRRLRRDEDNNLHVGVRVLANKIVGVELHDPEDNLARLRQTALLIERTDQQNGESWMLMKPDTFSLNYSPAMKLGTRQFLLLPVGLVEKGADFDWVTYRKMVSEVDSEAKY
jgi:hypothetical protein